jgi:hypothetical protein
MLGLVAMRRSNGNAKYVELKEFKLLQENMRKKIKICRCFERFTSLPVVPDNILDAVSNDLQNIRSSIMKYCVLRDSGEPEPESALLSWFQSRCGLSVKGKPQVAQALFP